MKDSELRRRTRQFAIIIIAACDTVDTRKGRLVLVNQIIRSATSIGANVNEAHYAASRADFINKLQIALKECFETEYWLDLMGAAGCISEETEYGLLNECGIIRKILVKSITAAKANAD